MATKRDNFSNKVIEILRSRVNNRCSNPDCRVPTTGPTKDPDKINNIGVAAHITAASPGGPRYDELLSPKERKDISNAIWLCSNCSRDIDNDPKKYTVRVLQECKNIAEKKASEELGTKLPDENYVINSLSSVLTGNSEQFLPRLISNSHKATSNVLEKLDRRFRVISEYRRGVTHFEVHAKEKVNAQLKVASPYTKEFFEKYTNLENFGEKLVIDSSAISFKGSPLLEKIANNVKGQFEISSSFEKDVTIKVWLVCPKTSSVHHVNDFTGKAILGKKAITCKTESLKGLVELTIRHNIEASEPDKQNFTFTTHLDKWDNISLERLPYFQQAYDLYNKIKDKWVLHISIEVEGLVISKGCCDNIYNDNFILKILSNLSFIHDVRAICKILKYQVSYDSSFEYSAEFHSHINEIYRVLSEGISLPAKELNGKARCELVVSDDYSNVNQLVEAKGKPMAIRFDQSEEEKISIFNQEIIVPPFSYQLTETLPKIMSDICNLSAGDIIEVEWEPVDDCKYIINKA
ncbi:hypothetical protein [Desulfosediminicola sp.]|uniref:hypothetical protein n=1 Tax=Desulfosediminicola sp. TaxID=2886825 RepID=UPI003AF29964